MGKSPSSIILDNLVLAKGIWRSPPLSAVFDKGKTTVILGRSGIGKSSLLNHLAMNQNAAYMAQKDLLLPWLTIEENIGLGYSLRGSSYPSAKSFLLNFGLDESFLNRYPETLSGGERSRIALARTLFEQKPTILMDEPFAALDAITRMEIHALTKKHLYQKTAIMVTHDIYEAITMANNIWVMDKKGLSSVKKPYEAKQILKML